MSRRARGLGLPKLPSAPLIRRGGYQSRQALGAMFQILTDEVRMFSWMINASAIAYQDDVLTEPLAGRFDTPP